MSIMEECQACICWAWSIVGATWRFFIDGLMDVVHFEQPMSTFIWLVGWEQLVVAPVGNTTMLSNALDRMMHGISWWSCIHWRLHTTMILQYLVHWGAEIETSLDFDALWDAYLWAHLWGVFVRSHLMEMINRMNLRLMEMWWWDALVVYTWAWVEPSWLKFGMHVGCILQMGWT